MVGNHYFFYWTTSGGWFTERGKLRIKARLFVFKCNKSDIKSFLKVRPHFSIVMVIYDKKISNDWWICTLLILDNQKYNIDAKNIESMCNKKDDLRIWSSKKALPKPRFANAMMQYFMINCFTPTNKFWEEYIEIHIIFCQSVYPNFMFNS